MGHGAVRCSFVSAGEAGRNGHSAYWSPRLSARLSGVEARTARARGGGRTRRPGVRTLTGSVAHTRATRTGAAGVVDEVGDALLEVGGHGVGLCLRQVA